MQRYGIVRIYGRKAGDGLGPLERLMLVAWFLVPLLWCAASGRLHGALERLSSGTVGADAARILASLGPEATVGVALAGAAAAYLTARWLSGELGSGRPVGKNAGKWVYVGSTAGLFVWAMVDPVAAVMGFVASHSIEYFVLVGRSVGSEAVHPGPLGGMARRPGGRAWFFVVYGAAATAAFVLLYRLAPDPVLVVGALTIGAVHFFYDAFIWKLRKPAVAASLAVGLPS